MRLLPAYPIFFFDFDERARLFEKSNRASDCEQFGIDSHAHNCIRAQVVECIHLLLAAYAACDDELALGKLAQARGRLNRKALHQAFAIDVCVKKCGDMGFELGNRFIGSERDLRLPTLDGDAAVFGIDAGNDMLGAWRPVQWQRQCPPCHFQRKARSR